MRGDLHHGPEEGVGVVSHDRGQGGAGPRVVREAWRRQGPWQP